MMNFKKFYPLVLTAFASFLLLSCSDDTDNNTNDDEGIVYLPATIVNTVLEDGYEGMASLYFRYDSQDRVTYIIQSMGDAPAEMGDTLSFTYDSKGRISSVVTPIDTSKFSYDGNKVFRTQNYSDGYYRDTLELGVKGELLKLYSAEYFYTYEYDSQGNLTKYTGINRADKLTYTTSMTYDNKNGLFKHIKTPSWYFIIGQGFPLCFVNNTLSELHEDGSADMFTSEYNDAGYPLSVDVDGESRFRLNIEYIIKDK